MKARRVARIARWEATRIGTLDRRMAAVGVLALMLVLAIVPLAALHGVTLDEGIYRAGVAQDNPYHDAIAQDPTFRVRPPSDAAFEDGELELLFHRSEVEVRDSPKGRAAVAALADAVEAYNDRQMGMETNESAAFPVFPVTVRYVDRNTSERLAPEPGRSDTDTGDTTTGGTGGSDSDDDAGTGPAADNGFPGILGGGFLTAGGDAGTPSDVAPPFPFQSLILAFLFVLPLNFIIQAYGSSVLKERINRRGELLLVAPVTRGEIIAGKTAPYFLASIGITVVIAVGLGGGPLSVLAIVPLALLFLAATFVGAMFARSFKELTFLTTTVSALLTAFAFVPAVFTDSLPVALISPLTLTVLDLAGQPVSAGGLVFSILPSTLTAGIMFLFGAGLYREEDLFTQRAVHLKVLDALASRIHRARSLVFVTALLVPFVFVAELLAVALVFAVPVTISIPLVLAVVAVLEEVAKSLPVLAGYVHGRFRRATVPAAVAGLFAGVGFFLGEKLALLVQLVGLPQFRVGRAAFGGVGIGGDGLVLIGLLLAPLLLHVGTAMLSAIGASRDRETYLVALTGAILVHLLYNLAVVGLYG